MDLNKLCREIVEADLNVTNIKSSNIEVDLPKYFFNSKEDCMAGAGRDAYVVKLKGNSKELVAKIPKEITENLRRKQWGEIIKNYFALKKAYEAGHDVINPRGFGIIRDISSDKIFYGLIMENAGEKNILQFPEEERKNLISKFDEKIEKMKSLFPGEALDENYKNGIIDENGQMKICEILN